MRCDQRYESRCDDTHIVSGIVNQRTNLSKEILLIKDRIEHALILPKSPGLRIQYMRHPMEVQAGKITGWL